MKILELKSTMTDMANSLEGLKASLSWQEEKISNFEERAIEML